jgi:hypothetical protein
MAVFWSGFTSASSVSFFNSSSVWWQRFSIQYPNIGIFPSNGTVDFR